MGEGDGHVAEATDERNWTAAPGTLFAYFLLDVVAAVQYMVVQDMALYRSLAGLAIALAILVGLLMRAKVAWILAVFIEGLAVIGTVGPSSFDLVQLLFALAGLVLLSLPSTRAWCRV